jgi:glycosyltransferase involved in cell wall biosynthesis
MSVDYSIIVPAYNEEALLSGTILELRTAMAGLPLHGELIVVDNNSTDKTAAIAGGLGASVVFEPINQISRARCRRAHRADGIWCSWMPIPDRAGPCSGRR